MKLRQQVKLGQRLAMTPQLQQALHLLQLPSAELDAAIAAAVESNPLLDWIEPDAVQASGRNAAGAPSEQLSPGTSPPDGSSLESDRDGEPAWEHVRDSDRPSTGDAASTSWSANDTDAEQAADSDSLQDHLLWQLHLSHLSPRDQHIGAALIEAIDEDGYLRDAPDAVAASLAPELRVDTAEILAVLRRIQHFDPAGVGARDLGECLRLQLDLLPDSPGKVLACSLSEGPLQRLPQLGVDGLATELGLASAAVQAALDLLRGLDPRPGAQVGPLPADTYIVPDVLITRRDSLWQVALAAGQHPPVGLQHGYAEMAGRANDKDGAYLRARLQEARWLLRSIQSRGETLLKVMRCVASRQAGFLESGPPALRPLTLREVATEIDLHESTVSRAVARKYAQTPRGTIALREFFASGVSAGDSQTSSTAIQAMLSKLVAAENPHKPLSDARLAASLQAEGVPVARRTIAKYREAVGIPSSQERRRVP